MSPQIVKLGPGECPDLESSARYFAALAYPMETDAEARSNAAAAWVASYLHKLNEMDGSTDPFEDTRLNQFVELQSAWCRATLRSAMRRLRDRSDCARAVRPWILELLGGHHAPVPGVAKFTQRQIALYLCNNQPQRAANFERRVWRASRPVIHLAAANDLYLSEIDPGGRGVGIDLSSANLIRDRAVQAARLQPLIAADPRFGVEAAEQVTLLWVEDNANGF